MHLSILVPSSIREHFARYVDSNLSACEDWRLVFYQKNATSLSFVSPEVHFKVRHVLALIYLSISCADSEHLPAIMRQRSGDFIAEGDDLDLWSFDLNPYRLVDSVEEVLSLLGGLGCYWALHSFDVSNRPANADSVQYILDLQ